MLESFLNKVAGLRPTILFEKTPVQVFSYKYCNIFIEHLQETDYCYTQH